MRASTHPEEEEGTDVAALQDKIEDLESKVAQKRDEMAKYLKALGFTR